MPAGVRELVWPVAKKSFPDPGLSIETPDSSRLLLFWPGASYVDNKKIEIVWAF